MKVDAALIVDDDPFIRFVLGRQLESLGVSRVDIAENGLQAGEALRTSGPYDLIITDLQMPDMDGVELLREIQDLRLHAGVILMSSFDAAVLNTVEEIARQRQLRLLGCLRKPINKEHLAELIQKDSTVPRTVIQRIGDVSIDDLRTAIQEEALSIEVQPKIEIKSGRLDSVEALARWNHPRLGSVSPGVFIGLAEQNGLIVPLTYLILRKAIRACSDWFQNGLDVPVAVNISVDALDRLDLPDRIRDLVHRNGIKEHSVILEITESVLVNDLAKALDILVRLRLNGFQLSIDDFGTGYSSLQQLGRVPFSELKIDRSFVAAAPQNREAHAILVSSVQLAQQLGLKTIAEGVETEEQLALVDALGCDIAQGFLMARPMPPKDLLPWWRARGGRLPLRANSV